MFAVVDTWACPSRLEMLTLSTPLKYSIEAIVLIPNVNSDVTLGRYVAVAGQMQGDPRFPEAAWPYMDEHIPTTGVCVEDANELAWAIEGMQCEDGELLKYLSVLSVEQPGTMQEALRCAMNLDDYERIPEDTYEYGQAVLRRIGADDELIDTIDGYMDFEKLGEDTMAEEGVRRTEFGLIRRCSSPFAEETQAMEMGGLS